MTDAPNWEGVQPRECGEHRTVGSHRAWCFDCTEWCYSRTPDMHCRGCELPGLRARLAEVEAERDELRDEIGNLTMHDAAVEWRKAESALARWQRIAQNWMGVSQAQAEKLARVGALCDQWDDLPNHVRRDIDAFDVICEVRAALRGPQDEEGAEAKLAAVARVRDWMVENNDDAEYDLVIVALNNILEGGGRG